jgi:hypothetical protein
MRLARSSPPRAQALRRHHRRHLRTRGLDRVRLHADLTILAKLGCALAKARVALAAQAEAAAGSGRTRTVSATGMISSTGKSAREAWSRIASGLLAW